MKTLFLRLHKPTAFWAGFRSAFTLWPVGYAEHSFDGLRSKYARKNADSLAIKGDWERVGQALGTAMDKHGAETR